MIILAFCVQLTTLNLEANPVCKIAHYRQIIANFLPQLTTLDDKPITDDERVKISDEEIDVAIRIHQEELLTARGSVPATVDDRLLIADGIKSSSCYDSPHKLSRSSSTQRVAGIDPASVCAVFRVITSFTTLQANIMNPLCRRRGTATRAAA